MKYLINLEQDETGMWVIECPAVPGCISQGETEEDALKNIEEAITLCLEAHAEVWMPLIWR